MLQQQLGLKPGGVDPEALQLHFGGGLPPPCLPGDIAESLCHFVKIPFLDLKRAKLDQNSDFSHVRWHPWAAEALA